MYGTMGMTQKVLSGTALRGLRALASTTILTALAMSAAFADDTEIFFGSNQINVPANILLILDTSGSMNEEVNTAIYDPATTYSGSCSSGNVYFTAAGGGGGGGGRGGGRGGAINPPACNTTTNFVPVSSFMCNSATLALSTEGKYLDNYARWGNGGSGSTYKWRNNLSATINTGSVECQDDNGLYGNGNGGGDPYPDNNTTGTNVAQWAASSEGCWGSGNCGAQQYWVYSGNYANYVNSGSATPVYKSRLEVVRRASVSLLNTLNGVSVGVMRYDSSGEGGMVAGAVAPIADNRTTLINTINSWIPAGSTPLSETLFEAYRYYSGGDVRYGNSSHACTAISNPATGTGNAGPGFCTNTVSSHSVAASLSSSNVYNSPADYSCQKNYIVYLTDGQPTSDTSADADIKLLSNFVSKTGGCESGFGNGLCLGALAEYMYESDLRLDVDETQNVTSYFVGFGAEDDADLNAYFTKLENAAERAGGQAFRAANSSALASAFDTIAADIAEQSATLFSAPTVAVNAFNRTQTLDDLYVSVFLPSSTYRWIGNVKKYRMVNEEVRAKVPSNVSAVDPATGFFKDSATSYWSDVVDGADVALGGAANKLPAPDSRIVYTYLGADRPTSGQSLEAIQTAITATNADTVLARVSGSPTWENLVAWARGFDPRDEDEDSAVDDARNQIGDPVHSEPGVVIYGAGVAGSTGYETVIYVTTNDGYLHAIDATAAPDGTDLNSSGSELWSYIPKEMLPDLQHLYTNAETTTKHYGLDGPVRVIKYDIDRDGRVEPTDGDRVMLYFSTGRNRNVSRYYALDVTDKTAPRFMWSLSSSDLPGVGQTWSPPSIARVKIGDGSGQASEQKFVLIFGGGYDPDEDGYSYNTSDDVGAHIYMVDAKDGELLWSAGASGTDFQDARMTHSIPSAVTVLDVDNDGYADRMYVGDMAAQVWRFDIHNEEDEGTLVTGGVLASLGTKESDTHQMSETRRFYAPVDAALIQVPGKAPYINLAIGSGYRGHPLNKEVDDKLFSLWDTNPFVQLNQDAYDDLPLIGMTDLLNITSTLQPTSAMFEDKSGWVLDLELDQGEKVLTAARTLDNIIYFTSYSPETMPAEDNDDPCTAAIGSGSNRIYAVSVFTGAPATDRNGDSNITIDERSADLGQGGISPGVSLLFPAEQSGDVVLMSGPEVVAVCQGCRNLRKTYWRDASGE